MIPLSILVASIVVPVLASLGIIPVGTSVAAGYAVLTLVVAEAIITMPRFTATSGGTRSLILVATVLMACIVSAFGIRLAALPVMAFPIVIVPALSKELDAWAHLL